MQSRRVRNGLVKCGVAAVLVAVQQLRRTFGIDLSMPSAINPFTGEPATTTGVTELATPLPPIDPVALLGPMLWISAVGFVMWAMTDFVAAQRIIGDRRKVL